MLVKIEGGGTSGVSWWQELFLSPAIGGTATAISTLEESCLMKRNVMMESSTTKMAPAHSKLVEPHDTENDSGNF